MARMITLRFLTREHGERAVQIQPHWAGQGIAIHKPISFEDGEPVFTQMQGYWRLSHIPTGHGLGSCMGSLDRAKGFAKPWDEEFAAVTDGQAMAPDRIQAWGAVVEEMRTEPPRRPSRIEIARAEDAELARRRAEERSAAG